MRIDGESQIRMRLKDIEDSYPLSPLQQGMLFHSQYAPQSGVYVQQLICALREELNVPAFKRAWERVLERHPVLRTSFCLEEADEPLQRVHRHARLSVEEQDWRGLSAREQKERLRSYLEADQQRGFDLTEAPLMRLALFRLAEADHRVVWTSHHALLDGRSRLLVLKELFALYEAFSRGRELRLRPSHPYRDYIDWLEGKDLTRAERFWRGMLSGFTAPTSLAAGHVRPDPSSRDQTFGKQTVRLSERATSALRSLAEKHQLTPNTFFQGAWALLLGRYSGEEDVVFGATRAGRHLFKGAESMVGLLINTVPVRARASSQSLLLPWLKELRTQWIAMREFEHTPLVKVQQWSEVPAGKPLFESLLVFESYQLDSALRRQEGWERREFQLLGTTHYPLTVTGYLESELLLEIVYDRGRFDDDAMTRMLGHLRTLLEEMVAHPQGRLSELPLLTEAERRRLLIEWNDTKRDYPRDKCIHQLFEEQAERTPEAVAVIFEDQQLTYRELNRRANQLAHYLRKLGVRSEVLVGICMERSLEMVVGLLGILKAGGAYVPLDSAYPQERLGFMLGDAGVAVLLSQEKLLSQLPETSRHAPFENRHAPRAMDRPVVLCLDTEWEAITEQSEENPPSEITPENLAYVIYTSGSTGRPKGVAIEHRSAAAFAHWAQGVFSPEDLAGVLASTSLCFDLSVFEFFAPLSLGGKIILAENALQLSGLSTATEVTLINTVPSAITELLRVQGIPNSVRTVNLAGEPLSTSLVEQLYRLGTIQRVYDLYGPSEDTTYSTFALRRDQGRATIGRPIANSQVYLLDPYFNPVPIGVVGELYLGGAGLARGYLNRPDLTAEKFIPNPFSEEPGARLYKSGDLARYLPDGNIEFLGRIDHQVKIRGFRIELGEIEAALTQHPAVEEAVVVAREDGVSADCELRMANSEDANPQSASRHSPSLVKRLVAYVVQKEKASVSELHQFLKQKLPEYMIPSAFVFLESLPLTPSGKVDRRALPAPDEARPDLKGAFVAPRTQAEEVIAGIWAELLRVERVGVHDNFFDLGGHSLLATRLISRLRGVLGVTLTLENLFEMPTVVALAEHIDKARRSKQRPPRFLERVSRNADLPLSFAQQRLWFLEQLEPGSSTYNIARAFRISGDLKTEVLRQALNAIVDRHESLRTTFAARGGEPVQVIADRGELPISEADLRKIPAAERETAAQRLVAQEGRRPFDLVHGPLVRVVLLRLSDHEHILMLAMHHIVSDGWSMAILYREWATLYEAFSQRLPSPLGELPIQYADYAVWQREWLQGEESEQQLSYWKQQLAGAPAALELTTDWPRPPVQTFRGSRQHVSLPPTISELLKALSRREGVTLYMTLLAAFNVLLYRYTGQSDIVIGSPIAGRTQIDTEELIGYFANTLVLRTNLSGDPTFRMLLKRVRQVALEAYAHQELPFEKLVELVQPERDLSYNPLFQVLFAVHNNPPSLLKLPDLIVEPLEVDSGTARFDLAFDLRESPQGLIGAIEYNTDLFDSATIMRILGHFQTLLESIAADPDQRLSILTMLTKAERRELLVEWNGRPIHRTRDFCMHELFEAQAEKIPDAVAVVCERRRLTYRELNARANQVAHYLRKLGVKPEVPVGICLDRSVEMVVGLLGILKAGGAYVPLDPDYPAERIAYMLEDTGAPILLTQRRLIERLPERASQVLCLDADWPVIAEQSEENLSVDITPENLAYVIYTSGSTGRPKGVQICHRSVARLLEAVRRVIRFDEHDVWTVFHSYAFDFSVWEIWGALLEGARLIVVPRHVAQSPAAFYDLLRAERVTVLNQTPSAMRQLVEAKREASDTGDPWNPRLIICGGEAFPRDLVFPLKGWGASIWNFYGPTEATVWAAINPITSSEAEGESIPVGRPIADRQIYLLDTNLQPVPVGVPGELHIGGVGLARGYFKRPELTAEGFIPNSFSNEPGARLYKTGDLARYLPDGNIEFLGRIDNQVKIRGFRIELGEIEAVLGQHSAVQQAVVVAREEITSDDRELRIANSEDGNPQSGIRHSPSPVKRLVAYVIPKQRPYPTVSELRAFLKEKLPEYMVPSAFVMLDALPLTPNGKIDRRALPVPDCSRPELGEDFVAPRTPVETALAQIWSEVLQVERVGIHDNFFDLGGHSLLATQLVSRLRSTFQVEISLRSLFEAPTVAGLGERIERACKEQQGLKAPPIVPVPRDGNLPLSFAQQRLWLLDQLEPGNPTYNMPVVLRLRGLVNVKALEQSLNEIVRRHEALRTTFSTAEGQPIQVIAPSLTMPLQMVDLQEYPAGERESRVRQMGADERKRLFDLAQGPLLRTTLLRLGPQDHILLLTLHHIISDGWSMGVFFRELSALYPAFSTGKPSPLPDLPIQYSDYALWQRQWLQGEVLDKQLAYWRQQLAALPVLELPTDHPRPPIQTYRGARQSLFLSKTLTQALKDLSRQESGTLFMTLLAAFKVLLHKYTGQNDIVVGSPIAGRNQAEIEGLIGFFLNSLVLRTDLSGDPSFRELLARVRDVALGAYAHQDLPFEKLLEELQPERDLSRTPLFQVFFNMVDLGGHRTLDLPEVRGKLLESHEPTAKFDLTLYAGEKDGALQVSLVFNPDLFEAATISRLLGHYHTLLKAIAASSQQSISSLPLLTEAERNQLAARRNRVAPAHPFVEFKREDIEQSIAARFERQVTLFPDKAAMKTKGQQWTYRELNRKANQIAREILKERDRREERIGLLFDHGSPMIAAILGVLKAGKTYVPLDPASPKERLAYLIEDSQAKAIITNNRNIALAKTQINGGLELIQVDDAEPRAPADNPNLAISPGSLAYILYTSGSTGQPKGVMQNHRNVLHHIRNYTNHLHLNSDDRLTLFSSYSFDAAVMDIFGALLNGATLYPMDIREENLSQLIDRMIKEKITIYHSTPTLFRYLLGTLSGKEELSTIRLVVMGGEEVQKKDIDLFKQHFPPHSIFVNGYGPTECTLALQYFIDHATPIPDHIVPVGYPVEDTKVVLLNGAGKPVDHYGEIGIRSSHVALGYWRKPEMTRAAFLPDPEGGTKRIYRTGDMGRLLSDGGIGYIGRKDFQVKIRGFRVEMGEIEAALTQHQAVGEAVVVAREGGESADCELRTANGEDGNPQSAIRNSPSPVKRLVAYIVADRNPAPTVTELRQFLKQKLPEYMIPSAFVFLDALPLTPNGKVDRKALPVATQGRPQQGGPFVQPPSTVEEKKLAEIWSQILKVEKVGVHDDFFDLGGHSLLATQVISRLREAFKIEIPLRTLFENPTIAGLAVQVAHAQAKKAAPEEMADVLADIESLSDEEAERLVAEEGRKLAR